MRKQIYRFLFPALLFLLLAGPAIAQEQPTEDPLEWVPEFIEKLLKEWEVPGLAIVVVKDGDQIFARGFGFRDVEAGLPVTPDTLFAIGSCSKAFTALAMGILVEEGKLKWDEPVRDYLPDFKLYDEYASNHMTPRDLVTHRSGLPRHDLLWYGAPLSRRELYERLRYLEPSEGFREVWQYQNLMFMTAGYLVGRVSGGTWEEFVQGRIFDPLGMERSNFSVIDMRKDKDFSQPYGEREEKTEKIPFRNIDAVGPAGSINSSVNEMSKWLLLHLNKGEVGEEQVISEAGLTELHTPQMVIRRPLSNKEVPVTTYSHGWLVAPYRGHLMLQHGGGIDGFISVVAFLPHDNIGVVVLTNKSPNPLTTVVCYTVFDRLLNLPEIDWNKRSREQMDKAKEAEEESEKEKDAKRKSGTAPSHQLQEYAGAYEHAGYGRIEVEFDGEKLSGTFHSISGELEHFHYDVFRLKDEIFGDFKLHFLMNLDGEIESISVPLQDGVEDIVFKRVFGEGQVDEELLNKVVGEYEIMGRVLTVALRADGTLTLAVPGQPTYELLPFKGTEFKIKDLEGYSVEFRMDEEGKVTEAVLHQPQGTFVAKRKK